MSRPLSALVLAVLLVASVVGGVAAGAQGQQGPPGHAAIPEHAVTVGQGQQAPPGPSDPAAWAPSASDHVGDMTVEVRSPRADDRLELVFGDDANHAGREVAVSTRAVREALGRTPQVAYVTHESGDRYAVPVENNGETLSWTIREFSENTVTFEGEVSIQGSPATDGAQYSYSIQDLEDVANFSIDVTGSTARAWSNVSTSRLVEGESLAYSIGGTTAPEGPANGDPRLEVTSHAVSDTTGRSGTVGLYPDRVFTTEVNASRVESGKIDTIGLYSDPNAGSHTATVDMSINGTVVASQVTVYEGEGWQYFTISPTALSGNSFSLTIDNTSAEFDVTVSSTGSGGTATGPNGGVGFEFEGLPGDVTVDADDGTSQTFTAMSDGETRTAAFPVSRSSSSLSVTDLGAHDVALELQEVTETIDPAVEVNGHTTSYTGTLADGSTTALTTNTSWIAEGENRVNVSLSAPASGPTPQVGLDYRHEATALQNTTFDGETWSERYNVSRTFGSDQSAATLTIPFSSDRVVAMRDVQHRVDGGSWQSVSQYSLSGTELTVELGDVVAGEQHDVRAVGAKVQVTDGAITVLEPTYEGNTLDSKVRVDQSGSNFSIGVAGTEPSSYVHYTVSESWQGTPFAEVRSNGDQTLHLGPPDGGEFRVRTVPLSTVPESGHVSVIVEDGAEPEFTLRDHSSDVNVTYYDTKTGKTYALIDAETGDEVMRDTAESPVHFWADDSTATYLIDLASSTGSGATGGTAVAVAGDSPLSTLAIFVGLAGSIIGFVFVGRKFGARGARQNLGLVAGGLAVAIVAIEAVTAGSFLGELAAGGGAIVGGALGGFINSGAGAVVSGIGMFWAVYAVHERFGLPTWLLVISGLAIGVFTFDNVTDGALSGGLAEVSALLWLGIVFGGIALLWRVLQPRPIQIRGS